MNDDSLEQALLKALRRAPGRRPRALAQEVGLARTNFGRPLTSRVLEPLEHLEATGLVEHRRGRYRLSDKGRRALADRALGGDESVPA